MKTHLDCIPCLLKQIIAASRLATNNKGIQEKILEKSRYSSAFAQLASGSTTVHTIIVKNAEHFDFCDCALYKHASPILKIANSAAGVDLGTIDGLRATTIINTYLVNFFAKYLKNKSSALLDGTEKQYAEVEVKESMNNRK